MLPKIPKQTLQEWAEMTSNNDHRRVRQKIAEWLCVYVHPSFIFYSKLFFVMEDCIQKRQIPHEFLSTECSVTDIMLNDLEKNYKGKRLVNVINKCL